MAKSPIISCEFFPPKTEKGVNTFLQVATELAELQPAFYSVTFGAGGSTQHNTLDAVIAIQQRAATTGIDAAPHLSCVGSSRQGIRQILQTFIDNDISRLVALRGDLPSGMRDPGEFRYANELVEFIRAETGDHFTIEVAAYPEVHPQAPNANIDFDNFVRKVDAGADSAITQYFYNIDAYLYFVDRCEQAELDIPIIPGIMPINNYSQLARFSAGCGAEIPRWLSKRLEAFHDDTASLQAFTTDFLTDFTQQLLDLDVPGLHFYTMNKTQPVLTVCERLGLLTP
ncbi:5,10-methylenetetrahydrofolate reductase [Methylophaga frappieri]|uniref:Methylenetetrahydrofolate reductase n=1 Tax=Methylophaga frappieri (strain ATCC BAA-2434 / DSM 25690 / JAM7) TaxID=754477 RepID=I1YIU8_METFJ|nr:methylenetetrahydrofolate reductase [NAD(P)H] [Methylophaga frappieri]AFJ02841.1 5,10-methylenetetrahydrofolate reductase [Methylophaga frappieri]